MPSNQSDLAPRLTACMHYRAFSHRHVRLCRGGVTCTHLSNGMSVSDSATGSTGCFWLSRWARCTPPTHIESRRSSTGQIPLNSPYQYDAYYERDCNIHLSHTTIYSVLTRQQDCIHRYTHFLQLAHWPPSHTIHAGAQVVALRLLLSPDVVSRGPDTLRSSRERDSPGASPP